MIAVKRGYAVALSMLLVLGLLTGCTDVVEGSKRPAPGLVPRPLTGNDVKRALLDGDELSRAFGQPFKTDPDQPGAAGGGEILEGNAQTPPDCGGVVTMLLKDGYAGSDVRKIVRENWLYSGQHPAVIIVQEAVVALPTAQAASTQFATMERQWKRCSGATMTIGGDPEYTSRVGEVQDKDSVLAAPVDDVSSSMTLAEARAVGVRVNCILEIKVIYFGLEDRDSSARKTPTPADVVRLLMDKVSALT